MSVKFDDYPTVESKPGAHRVNAVWSVLDPVNATNNVVPAEWGNIELSELADWFEAARDAMARVVSLEMAGRAGEIETVLSKLFGAAIITHGAAK